MANNSPKAKVLIIGCGFGGLAAARALKNAAVEVTVVDRTNHHLFQPLLYQVATAVLSTVEIAEPTRHIFRNQKNLTVLLGEVTGIDVTARRVTLAAGTALDYDHLIVAAGATHGYFGRDEWAEHAPGLKSLDDALNIRRRLLLSFEKAELSEDPAERAALLTSVVIGGGPTGVEMAGAIAEISRNTLAGEFRRIDPRTMRVMLIEGSPRLLSVYDEDQSEEARRQLAKLGVEVVTSARVMEIDDAGLSYDHDGKRTRVEVRNKVWAAGVKASPLGKLLADATGAKLDRAGRVEVAPDLTLPGFPEIAVIGDLAAARSYPKTGEPVPVPGVSQGAMQAGELAAKNILRRLRAEPAKVFIYHNKGDMATIGRSAAVAKLSVPVFGKIKVKGFAAWLLWLFVHIFFLIGFRNRMTVMADWAWSYFTFKRHARIVTRNP